MPPRSTVSDRHGSSVRAKLETAESVSAMPAGEKRTLLQALVQPTRQRCRVQPRFEAFSLDGPDCSQYSLESCGLQHSGSGVTASDRGQRRQTGPRNRAETASTAAEVCTTRHPLRQASGVPLSPTAADGGPSRVESHSMDGDQQPQCMERMAQPPPARPGAVRGGSSSGDPPPPGCGLEEEALPTIAGLNVAEVGCNDSYESATGACDGDDCSDGRFHPKRPPPQHVLGRPHESSPLPLQEVESSWSFTRRYSAPLDREGRDSRVGAAVAQPQHSGTLKSDERRGNGSVRLGCGDAAVTDYQDEYEPSLAECEVDSSRPPYFQDALPAAAQCYRRLHVAGTNGGRSDRMGSGPEWKVGKGSGFDGSGDAYEDGGGEWEDALAGRDGATNADAAPDGVRSFYRENGEGHMGTESVALSRHDGAGGEPSHRLLPPPALRGVRSNPPPPASSPAEAPASVPLHPRKHLTGHMLRRSSDRAASLQLRPVEGDANQLSSRSRKKERSTRHNPRAFRNRTTYTWVSTNTTTSVILPSATVQLMPMSAFPIAEEVQPVKGHWAVSAPLSPPPPYALSSRSAPAHHQRRSQMEVLDDSAEAAANARNRVGNSFPYLPSRHRVEEVGVLRSMPAP
ncbi:hypothetical protein LSCM1_05750 [Leishmania martiniquensis]|uniref:Uncharacterized protein n=1 Tax=Leishmania martiniquensis TaxID=1580590 RepID=A0A836HSB8_9TRYP|nr:hypothetical protein LSCM1_05750 [Leishmania martiniquensis]